jgi:hypothetical protein
VHVLAATRHERIAELHLSVSRAAEVNRPEKATCEEARARAEIEQQRVRAASDAILPRSSPQEAGS